MIDEKCIRLGYVNYKVHVKSVSQTGETGLKWFHEEVV